MWKRREGCTNSYIFSFLINSSHINTTNYLIKIFQLHNHWISPLKNNKMPVPMVD